MKIKLFIFGFLMYNVRYQNTKNAMKGTSSIGLCLSESSRMVKGCRQADMNTSRSSRLNGKINGTRLLVLLFSTVGADGSARYSV